MIKITIIKCQYSISNDNNMIKVIIILLIIIYSLI